VKTVGRLLRNAVLALATFALVWLVVGWLRHRDVERTHVRGEEVAVLTAANAPRGTKLKVRGYVFLDSHVGTLLCSKRRTSGGRPACDGDVLTLEDLDTSRLALHHAKVTAGGYDAWSDGPVVVLGTAQGPLFLVEDVLQS
jgi:hypothetical protein